MQYHSPPEADAVLKQTTRFKLENQSHSVKLMKGQLEQLNNKQQYYMAGL